MESDALRCRGRGAKRGLYLQSGHITSAPMLSDRSYMRSDYPQETTSVLTWILSATLAGAALQFAFGQLGFRGFDALFALSLDGLRHFKVWTLASYVLLHGDLLHLLFNALGIFLIGREVAPLLGTTRFLQFYLAAAVLGGVLWLGVSALGGGGVLVGASACVVGMLVFFALVYPEREVTFLVFFVLPVTLKPKILAWGLLVFELLGLLFSELPDALFPTAIAHSAHLGGMLAAWVYFRFFYAAAGWDRASQPRIEFATWFRRRSPAPEAPPKIETKTETPARRDLRAEVDRILDKINSHGFGALTEDEKRILDDAKDMLSRR